MARALATPEKWKQRVPAAGIDPSCEPEWILQRLGVVAPPACRSSVPSLLRDDHRMGVQHASGSKTMRRHNLLLSLVKACKSQTELSRKQGKLTVIEVNSNIIQVTSICGVSLSASCIH